MVVVVLVVADFVRAAVMIDIEVIYLSVCWVVVVVVVGVGVCGGSGDSGLMELWCGRCGGGGDGDGCCKSGSFD